jgi:hypothetical protein
MFQSKMAKKNRAQQSNTAKQAIVTWALFIWLIIRLFQFVFLAGTVFFSHNKSANSVFSRLISTAERGLECLSDY